ncbi:peptidase family M48 [Beauveria bassiana ARSEF 2860]|uniref:CAAX prenyl protease n=1 Tax=Beauveria bassiana (strain ARSEF 2860) TaxID=655819 RepID=J5JT31_BEAB2|nr:peptidase family M48 [Beauveria bassiana ARSEF 2860]EJP65756.1 peptidase family M48 [Beauveria bassiana ARSEF 2860]
MTVPWKALVLLISFCHFVFESWLTLRQMRALRETKVPPLLADKLDQDTVTKSHSYKQAKARLSLARGLWGQFINAMIIYFDALPWLWNTTGSLLDGSTLAVATNTNRSILFALCYMWFSDCVYLPFRIYDTFVVEDVFGFNRQTPGLFFCDFIKIQALNSAILAPSLALFLEITARTGKHFALYVWLGAAAVQALVITLDPILFTPLFISLRPLSEESRLVHQVQALAAKVGFPLHRMYVSDDSKRSAHSNAYFYGFPWQMQIVVQDTLFQKASTNEILAIITHELGHWKYQHSSKLFLIQQVNLFVIFLSFAAFAGRSDLYHSFGFHSDTPLIAGFVLFYKVLLPVNSLLQLLHNAVCRGFEFTADRFAKDSGQGHELARALISLQAQNLGGVHNDYLYACYHHSHPGLVERLSHLGIKQKLK